MKKTISIKTALPLCTFFLSLFPLQSFAQCLTLSVTTTSASCSNCCDGSGAITVIGGCPTYTIAWNSVPTQYGATSMGLCPGNYSVTVSSVCCPGTTSYTFQMRYAGQTTGTIEIKAETIDLTIQNPIQENISIFFNQLNIQKTYEVKVLDLQSRIVYINSFTINNPTHSFKHNLTNGVYFIEIQEQTTKKIFKKKIVVNN
jgi:hypothetical protein